MSLWMMCLSGRSGPKALWSLVPGVRDYRFGRSALLVIWPLRGAAPRSAVPMAPATSPAAKETLAAITYCCGAPRPHHQGPWQYLWRGFDHGCSRAALRAIFAPAAGGQRGGL